MIHNTIELKKIIKNLAKFTLVNGVIPSSECIIFKKEYLSANNLEIGMKTFYNTDIDLLVPATILLSLLEQISDNTIEMFQQETILYIKTLKATYKLGGTNDPEIVIVDALESYSLEIHTFNYSLLSQFVNRKNVNINMSHYGIEYNTTGKTRIIATTGHKLVILGDANFAHTNTVVVPPSISVIAELLATESYQAGINEKTLVFTTNTTTYNIILAETKYLKYANVIPATLEKYFTIHAPSIITQIKRISKIAKNEILCLSVKEGSATLKIQNLDTNIEIEETISIKSEFDFYIGFKASNMISFLSLVKDTVNIFYSGPNKALLIKNDFTLGLVMPVELSPDLLPGAVTIKGKPAKAKPVAKPVSESDDDLDDETDDESDNESIDNPND
jgi:DNA polymerase III sliding clamp (beta) subunit (PCNA family)